VEILINIPCVVHEVPWRWLSNGRNMLQPINKYMDDKINLKKTETEKRRNDATVKIVLNGIRHKVKLISPENFTVPWIRTLSTCIKGNLLGEEKN